LFIDELNTLRDELGLTSINLLGHSWGGALAAEYLLTTPQGVNKAVLSSPLLDTTLWVEEADALKELLPKDVRDVMRRHEAAGTTDSKEYQEAYLVFRSSFVCRIKPYPAIMQRADDMAGVQVYTTMWGPSEAYATGTLRGWSVLERLAGITIPTLLLSGKYDEATPRQVALAQEKIAGAQWTLFEKSSHTANFEEPDKYLSVVNDFLIS
jgi:proline-specific peptidase